MKRFRVSLPILVILLMSQLALAQTIHQDGKSKAQLWSVGATLAPVVVGSGLLYISHVEGSDDLGIAGSLIASSGLVFGPGVGHAYAKQWGQTVKGTIIRAAGAGLFLWGVTTLEIEIDIWGTADRSSSGGGTPSELFIVAGGLMVVMSATHDLMTVSKSVDKYNRSQGLSDLRVAPTYFANHQAPGVILTLSF